MKITESVIIFGASGNVVMVLDAALPRDVQLGFRVVSNRLELMNNDSTIYAEDGLSPHICEKLKKKNEIGIMEITDRSNPPRHLTNIAYQVAS